MTNSSDDNGLASDSALENPENDQLGYQQFSQNLAETITTRVPSDEFVVGIYGQWGSGKSTILNFLENHLEEQDNPPIVVRFNPWWFSGEADLISKFFSQLGSGLKEGTNLDDVRNQLSKFASGLSSLPIEALTGVPTGQALQLLANTLDTETRNLDDLKDDIAENLEDAEQRIVVLIDDIDRLTSDEISQMFRLVKSVADFPNVTYVLAFDQNVVIDALEDEQAIGNGEEYLEKIIQLPLHVPIPEEDSLHLFLTERLDEIIEGTDPVMDQDAWSSVYRKGIRPTIETPRDAVRLTNAVSTMYNKLENEVNFVDLVAIETLRVFYRSAYEKIRNNPARFHGKSNIGSRQNEEDFDDLWEDFEDRSEFVRQIASYLFPRVADAQGPFSLTSYTEDRDTYRQRKRICHPDMFPYYFRQQVPRGELTSEQMDSILSLTDNAGAFAERLEELSEEQRKSGRSQAHNFLDRFLGLTNDISEDHIPTVVTAFFLIGDDLIPKDPRKNAFDPGNRTLVLRSIFDLLRRIEGKENRATILKEAFEEGDSVYLPTYFLGIALQEHGEYNGTEKPEEDRLLERSQIGELKEVAIDQVEKAAEEGELLDTYLLRIPLRRWKEWTDSEEAEEWAKQVTEEDENLLRFVEQFVSEGAVNGSPVKYIDPRDVEPFLDKSDVEERLEKMEKESLDDSEQEAVELFQEGMKHLKHDRDPSSLETWILPESRLEWESED